MHDLLQALILYFTFAVTSWPEAVGLRVALLGLPMLLWIVIHTMVWVTMRQTLRTFRWVACTTVTWLVDVQELEAFNSYPSHVQQRVPFSCSTAVF